MLNKVLYEVRGAMGVMNAITGSVTAKEVRREDECIHAGTMFANHGQCALAVADSPLPNPTSKVGVLTTFFGRR